MSGGTTAAPSAPNGIILFWYRASPYGKRVKNYLTLRHIQHAECLQPPILPRPDMTALGVNYRRSPVMTIGRDIYLDTRLMISKLEEMFPPSSKHPGLSSPQTAGMAALLQKLSVENLFREVVKTIPPASPMMKDPAFQKDRAGFFGPDWRMDDPKSIRPEGLTNMRHMLDIVESLFADGRQWVAGTTDVALADLEGIWAIQWFLNDLRPKQEYFNESLYPNVFAWKDRFRTAVDAAKQRAPSTVSLQGADAVSLVMKADFSDRTATVDIGDPLRLKEGDAVELFPLDSGGFTHQDRGRLVKLTKDEVAIAVNSKVGEEMRIHAPRWQFRVRGVGNAKL